MTYSQPALRRRLDSRNPDDRHVAAVMIGKARHHDKRILPQLVIPDVIEVVKDKQHPHAQLMAAMVVYCIPDDSARTALDNHWQRPFNF